MTSTGWILSGVVAVGLWLMVKSDEAKPAAEGIPISANYTTEGEAPEVSAGATPDAVLGGESHAAYDTRRDALAGSAGEYEGDGCTVDCGGHKAGHQWAEQNGVTDESECGGKSWSFREGCMTYAREQEDADTLTTTTTTDAE